MRNKTTVCLAGSRAHGLTGSRAHVLTGSRAHGLTGSRVKDFSDSSGFVETARGVFIPKTSEEARESRESPRMGGTSSRRRRGVFYRVTFSYRPHFIRVHSRYSRANSGPVFIKPMARRIVFPCWVELIAGCRNSQNADGIFSAAKPPIARISDCKPKERGHPARNRKTREQDAHAPFKICLCSTPS